MPEFMLWTYPRLGAGSLRTCFGIGYLEGSSSHGALPPWAFIISINFLSAEPSSMTRSTDCFADNVEPATPASLKISIPSFNTSSLMSSLPPPRRKSRASRTSSPIPTESPRGWFISVMRATHLCFITRATRVIVRASWRACSISRRYEPLPHFTSTTKPSAPIANFLLSTLAVISGRLGMVAVMWRIL